jgi:hypothetical protein
MDTAIVMHTQDEMNFVVLAQLKARLKLACLGMRGHGRRTCTNCAAARQPC